MSGVRPAARYRVVLSIGANLAGAAARIAQAFDYFADETIARSRVFRTPPWGGVEQGDFLNATLVIATDREPMEVLRSAWELEQAAGRVRQLRWGPRSLDVDIVSVIDTELNQEVRRSDPTLTLPHPWAAQRAFVLVPWLDADPDAQLGGVDVAKLVETLPTEEVAGVALAG